ncbi:MAG: hypothetical protein RIC56_00080 [Pseudomonadales bacterium]
MTTNRIFQGEDQHWYFHVRGNQAAGPFASVQEAGSALNEHVKTCQRRTDFSLAWPRHWMPVRLLRRGDSAARHS